MVTRLFPMGVKVGFLVSVGLALVGPALACSASLLPTAPPTPSLPGLPQTPSGFDTFTDESKSFLIAYPRDWLPAPSEIPEVDQYVRRLLTGTMPKEGIEARVGVTVFLAVGPVEEDLLQGVVNVTLRGRPEGMTLVRLAGVGDEEPFQTVRIDSREAIITYDEMYISEVLMRSLRLATADQDLFWSVTCSTTVPGAEHLQTCDAIIRSFRPLPR